MSLSTQRGTASQIWVLSLIVRCYKRPALPIESLDESVLNALKSHPNVKDFIFQLEKAEPSDDNNHEPRPHYQCFVQLHRKQRSDTFRCEFVAINDWSAFHSLDSQPCSTGQKLALKNYCMKADSRVRGPWSKRPLYRGADLACMQTPLPWQRWMLDVFAAPPDDRTIFWIYSLAGCIGKSKLVKYCAYTMRDRFHRFALGNAMQMTSALINVGARQVYLGDIPRTPSSVQKQSEMICVIEDLKNGFLSGSMYGKEAELIMDCPTVVIMSNCPPPWTSMTGDRFRCFQIESKDADPVRVYAPTPAAPTFVA